MVLQWTNEFGEHESEKVIALEYDVPRWFKLGLSKDEAMKAVDLPEDLLRQLWPDISRFGPNGKVVSRLNKDLLTRRKHLRSEDEFRVFRMAEAFNNESHIRFLNMDDFSAVEGETLEENLETLSTRFASHFKGLAMVTFTIVALDGFIDPDRVSDEELLIRDWYMPVFNQLLSFVQLNGEDYLQQMPTQLESQE